MYKELAARTRPELRTSQPTGLAALASHQPHARPAQKQQPAAGQRARISPLPLKRPEAEAGTGRWERTPAGNQSPANRQLPPADKAAEHRRPPAVPKDTAPLPGGAEANQFSPSDAAQRLRVEIRVPQEYTQPGVSGMRAEDAQRLPSAAVPARPAPVVPQEYTPVDCYCGEQAALGTLESPEGEAVAYRRRASRRSQWIVETQDDEVEAVRGPVCWQSCLLMHDSGLLCEAAAKNFSWVDLL